MIVDQATGKVIGDIADTPRVHGIALAQSSGHGFTTNGGDSTSTMFDLGSMAVIKKVHTGASGLDGIMYDDATDKVLTIDHGRPTGTAVVIDPKSGDVVTRIDLTGDGPEGGVSDGKGRIFINLEDKNAIDVIDTKTWKVVATWPIAPSPSLRRVPVESLPMLELARTSSSPGTPASRAARAACASGQRNQRNATLRAMSAASGERGCKIRASRSSSPRACAAGAGSVTHAVSSARTAWTPASYRSRARKSRNTACSSSGVASRPATP